MRPRDPLRARFGFIRACVLGSIALTTFANATGAEPQRTLPLSGVTIPKIATSAADPFALESGQLPNLPVNLPDANEAAKKAIHFVQGMTDAFPIKSVTNSERDCLSDAASDLAGDVTGASLQAAGQLHSLFGHMQSSFNDFSSLAKTGTSPPSQMRMGQGGVPVLGYGSGFSPPGGYPAWARAPVKPGIHTVDTAMATVEIARLTTR
jgi:hypothetical protein